VSSGEKESIKRAKCDTKVPPLCCFGQQKKKPGMERRAEVRGESTDSGNYGLWVGEAEKQEGTRKW
jgi:hypothetical protein